MPAIALYDVGQAQVAQALLQHQLFPNVKSGIEELPPFFGSESFTR